MPEYPTQIKEELSLDSDPGAAAIAAQILLLIALTMMNAFFAGAEMAVVSVNKNRIRMLADNGNKKAALIRKLHRISVNHPGSNYVCRIFFQCIRGDRYFTDTGKPHGAVRNSLQPEHSDGGGYDHPVLFQPGVW